jgi:hypothetical protein
MAHTQAVKVIFSLDFFGSLWMRILSKRFYPASDAPPGLPIQGL